MVLAFEKCYLGCIRIDLIAKRNNSGFCHFTAAILMPQHGVFVQSLINLVETYLQITHVQIFAQLFIYQNSTSIIFQLLDFIY